MSQTLNAAIAVVGIDIGKNSFHIAGQDERGAIVLRQKSDGTRKRLLQQYLPLAEIILYSITWSARASRKAQCEQMFFRFAPESAHCATQSACLKSAMNGSHKPIQSPRQRGREGTRGLPGRAISPS